VLLHTELGGEKRFSSTIARRLASLGALTKGDRGAADNADWARYNFETEEGRSALSLLYKRILAGETVRGLSDPRQVLRDMGLLVVREGVEVVRKEDQTNIPRFLNRVLALDVEPQNALFDYFAELFDQTVRYAKANGTFDEGVTDIAALAIRLAKPPVVVHVDKVTGAETVLYILEVDQPSDTVSFDVADRLRRGEGGAFFQNRKTADFILGLRSGRHTDPQKGATFQTYSVWTPESGRRGYIREGELNEKYAAVRPEKVEQWWMQKYAAAPPIETSHLHIVAGAIIPLWQRLKTKDDSRLFVTRVSTKDGQRIVGVPIPPARVRNVLKSIGLKHSSANDPEKVFSAVLDDDDEINLVSALQLKRARLHGAPAIELVSPNVNRFAELRKLGLINEQIKFKQRFFVPTDKERGLPILSELLSRYPVMEPDESEEDGGDQFALVIEPVESAVIDLEQWVLPPEQTIKSNLLQLVELPQTTPTSETVMHREESLAETFISELSDAGGSDVAQPFLWDVADNYAKSSARRRARQRPVIEEQGLLFSLQ
jgi:hypothetical protein